MKSIVFAVTNDLSYDQRMHRICTTLQEAGYTVELIGRRRRKSVELEKTTFRQRRLLCFFSKGPMFYVEYNIRLFFVLLRHSANIYGACDLDTALAVCLAAKIKKRKSVFDAHEHFTEVPEVERRQLVKSVWNSIGRWSIPRFHVPYTVGEAIAQVLSNEYHAEFRVIRNVPLLNDVSILPFEEREKLIVYQGALNEGRGLEQAIAMMAHLPDFRLKLIGEGDLSAPLRELTNRLGLNERVAFAGHVLPKDLYAQTCKAMIGLNLLESRSKSYYYSLANKFFDYMHAGVPSVNMDFPEYHRIIESNPVGACIAHLSEDEIVKAILKITSNREVFENTIRACEIARKHFAWQQEQGKLIEMFQGIGT